MALTIVIVLWVLLVLAAAWWAYRQVKRRAAADYAEKRKQWDEYKRLRGNYNGS